jgi:DNA repair protein RecN (Recombination protein N)
MLTSLTIKNYALIEEEEIEFGEGFNVITGETGAGKSIILSALSLALGGKVNKEAIRRPDRDAYIEAVFSISDDRTKEKLRAIDVEPYDDQVILSRRISKTRNKAMINGESVPSLKLKEAGAYLINIYGQNEHQDLLRKEKHMELVDSYGGDRLLNKRNEVNLCYNSYISLCSQYEELKKGARNRDKDLLYLHHEIEEIENASLKPGEDEEVENQYRRMKNSEKIMESINGAFSRTAENGASALLSEALSEMKKAVELDESLSDTYNILSDADGLINDFNREIGDYMSESSFDEESFRAAEARLDLINDLKSRYGATIEIILSNLENKKEEADRLENIDKCRTELEEELKKAEKKYMENAALLTELRIKARDKFLKDLRNELKDLNFTNTEIELPFEKLKEISKNGLDSGEFLISLNKGEPLKPLREVASGGELSRISLAIKTCNRENGDEALCFDEIDTGISGITAGKVAEKLSRIAINSQILCITHLPQIASFADRHFQVEKEVRGNETISFIKRLYNNDRVDELSRMLSGGEITSVVRDNAREMIRTAEEFKEECRKNVTE